MAKKKFDLGINSFVDTTNKTSVVFMLDTSESMNWYGGIVSMQNGVETFMQTLRSDPYASESVEVAIYTFNHEVKQVVDFQNVNNIKIPKFTAEGGTRLAPAVQTALDAVERKKQEYKDAKMSYKAPWIVLLTDADISEDIDSIVYQTSSLVNARKLTFFAIGTGDEVNVNELKRFNPKSPVIYSPSGEDLVPLFEWLSQSTMTYSQSAEGEKTVTEPLDRRYEIY